MREFSFGIVDRLRLGLALLFWGLMLALVAPAQAQADFFGKNLGKKPGAGNAAVVQTPHVRAELVAHAPNGLQPGEPAWLGLLLEHEPEWHSYWKNAGDSGMPTEFTWDLPPGLRAGEIAWPVPQKFRIGSLVNYGYEKRVLLPVPLMVESAPAQGGSVEVKLDATWLVCKLECVPEGGSFSLSLPVHGATAMHAFDFEAAWDARPEEWPSAQAEAAAQGERLKLRVEGLPDALRGQMLDVFVEEPYTIAHGAELGKDWSQQWEGEAWTADLPLSPEREDAGDALGLVLHTLQAREAAAQAGVDGVPAWRVVAKVTAPWRALELEGQWAPAAGASGESAPVVSTAPANQSTATPQSAIQPAMQPAMAWSSSQLWGVVVLALLGGAVLNLMPCVFPVLAIKALSLAHAGRGAQQSPRPLALIYGLGVVLSFAALGALMLALRSLGTELGWGFQLQSPWFVAGLALLFTLIGLALAGVVHVGAWAPQNLAQAQPKSAGLNAFLSGVLAVLIASPCTGPFMGAALGATLSLPAPAAMLVFVALGVGMALPFMALVWFPALLNRLPRPGTWMATFQKAMAFPMFATVVWLLWVLSFQVGNNGTAAVLLALWAISFALWLWFGRPAAAAAGGIKLAWGATLAAVLGVMIWALQHFHVAAQQEAEIAAAPQGLAAEAQPSQRWQPWSAQTVEQALARGQPVFVDYTASWCITCQYNKLNALSDASVLQTFDEHGVLLLRADWSRRNPEITAALQNLGRTGVPTYALYQPNAAPIVLAELLQAGELRATVQAAVTQR